MLKTAKSMKELDFDKLLGIYADILTARRDQEAFYSYLLDFFKDPNARYHIWEIDGGYSSALRTEAYQDGFLIAGLHTQSGCRGKGYAKFLLSAVCAGYDVPIYSHVEKRNIPSMRAHLSCGFCKVLDHAVFIDGSVSWNSNTLCLK